MCKHKPGTMRGSNGSMAERPNTTVANVSTDNSVALQTSLQTATDELENEHSQPHEIPTANGNCLDVDHHTSLHASATKFGQGNSQNNNCLLLPVENSATSEIQVSNVVSNLPSYDQDFLSSYDFERWGLESSSQISASDCSERQFNDVKAPLPAINQAKPDENPSNSNDAMLLVRPLLNLYKDVDLIQFSPPEFVIDSENEILLSKDSTSYAQSNSFFCDIIASEIPSDDEETAQTQKYNLMPTVMQQMQNEDNPSASETSDLFDVFFPISLPQVKSAAQLSVASCVSQNSMPICRICHLSGTDEDNLISPCRCSGTMQYIHNSCLMKWLEISSKRSKRPPSCELCLYQYHRHKKFKVKHWQFPQCSQRDKILHIVFIISLVTMIGCATATILCFKNDKGIRDNLDKTELTKSEVITLVCGVLFFVAFFVAMYVEVKSRNTLYKLMVKFIYLNQQWYIDEYDKKKDIQPVPI